MSTNVEAPPPRNLAQEGRDTLSTQIQLAPDMFAANQQYGPRYASLYNDILQQSLFGAPSYSLYAQTPNVQKHITESRGNGYYDDSWTDQAIAQNYWTNVGQQAGERVPFSGGGLIDILNQSTPEYGRIQANANTQQRLADIQDVENLGGRAVSSFNQANPELASLKQMIAQRAGSMGNAAQMIGGQPQVSALGNAATDAFNQRAISDLALGGRLGAQESRDLTNQVVSRFNRGGRANDPAAIASTALNLDQAQNNRLLQRQGAVATGAGLTDAYNRQALQAGMANQDTGVRVAGMNQQAQLANEQLRQAQQAQAMQILMQSQVDPFQAILGRSGSLNAAFGGLGQAGQGAGYQGSGQFNPFNGYSSDLYNTNYNADAAARISSANNNAALIGASIQALGAIGGGFAQRCYVAREVYGPLNEEWQDFREAMYSKMPAEFVQFYTKHGEEIAAEIHDNPKLKRFIRGLMDAVKEGN